MEESLLLPSALSAATAAKGENNIPAKPMVARVRLIIAIKKEVQSWLDDG